MTRLLASLTALIRPLFLAATLLCFFARGYAQAPAAPGPVRNAIVFTMHLYGSGQDPAPTVNTAVSASSQEWSFYRQIDGWFEVDVTRRREGTGTTARELVEFSRKRGGREEIIGEVSDSARNYERWIGEGFEVGVYADYTASESMDWHGKTEPLSPGFGVVFDSTNKKWIEMLDPQFAIGNYLPKMDFRAEADFKPSTSGGFGEPWSYTTDDPSQRLAGDRKQIEVRYHPGATGLHVFFPDEVRRNVPANFQGTVATGRVEYQVPRPDKVSGSWEMHFVVDWSARTELPDVELEVRCPDYERWRPTATKESAAPGPGRASGPGLNFAAELRRVDGNKNAPLPKIRSIEWRLVDTSREPGIAMNFPYKSNDKRPDMEIVAGDLTTPEDDTAQAVVIHSPGDPVMEASVLPYDWGGWTTLRVTAKLDDGRTVQGILRGGPHGNFLKAIRVPASHAGSKIAWGWAREFCPNWKTDADDEDTIPAGKPGIDGDGFSVYEEYRGFYNLLNLHVSTNPKQKDLFVRVDRFDETTAGVFQFFTISGLGRYFLAKDQLPRAEQNERVVNCNVGAGATCGPQTALYVRTTSGSSVWTNPIPAGSRPRSVPSIDVKEDYQSFLIAQGSTMGAVQWQEGRALLASTLVRSLFQAVGVERPGPPGKIGRLEFVTAPEAADLKPYFMLNGTPIVIETENGRDFVTETNNAIVRSNSMLGPGQKPSTPFNFSVIIGTRGSSHSGPDDCVMRDWFADLYESRYTRDGIQIYRFTLGTERPGTRLGTTRMGTGINDKNRKPEPRYGASAVAEPANRQLVVKDQAP